MAENDRSTKKKTVTSSTGKTSSTARSGEKTTGTKKAIAASKAPAKKKGKSKSAKNKVRDEAAIQRRSVFVQQFVPYILGIVVLIMGVCFILDAVGQAEDPSEHLMGFFGYYFCQVLFGCFGWAAYLIPLFLVNLIIFWKRNYEDGSLPVKVILSAVTLLFVSAVAHVFVCAFDEAMTEVTAIDELYLSGVDFGSGGVVGGLLGFLLYQGIRLPGTILVSVLVFPLLVLYLIGLTPAFVFSKLTGFIKEKWQKSKEARAIRRAEEAAAAEEEDDDDEEEEDEDEGEENEDIGDAVRVATAETYRQRRAREKAEAVAAEQKSTDADAEGSAPENVVVDTRTGEVLGTAKSRLDRNRSSRAEEVEEPQALPFYDTPSTEDEWNSDSMLEEAEDFDGPDTMEVGYDDDIEDSPAAPRDSGTAKASPKASRQKPDPYASVRILERETTAVAEGGLSEEEIVISSATRPDAAEEAVPVESEEIPAEEAEVLPPREYVFPPVDLLTKGSSHYEANEEEIAANTQVLRDVLESFRIGVKEISCSCGPTITRFEVKPDSGVRVRSIANLVDDIAMGLAKAGVRIEAPIPGKAAVGIEVPNAEPATVYFRSILETPEFRNHKSRIAACLGADVSGRPVILDINKMPHLLVAGTTGSGKSVCINSIIMSILYKAKPDEVKLILIDPKKVEFAVYRDLPHLYCPIISDPKKAAGALNSAVNEMERRFELIEEVGVRNLAGYNEVTADDPARPPMPQMVIIIDELADLMMTASNEVETAICRLAQKARAAGMHLILGTQRPSTDVITGLIKANIPSRIAFTVTQQIDSRIIIDSVGAEKLIGRGDMLYSPVGTTKPLRVQGTFISDSEVERVVTFLKENNERVEFDESFTRQIEIEAAKCAAGKKKGGEQVDIDEFSFGSQSGGSLGGNAVGGRKDNEDPKFWEALEVTVGKEKIGTSALQRALNLGYGRAAKIIDRMEELGFVGPDPGTKQGRKVLITKQEFLEYRANGLPTDGNRSADGADTADVGSEGDFDDL